MPTTLLGLVAQSGEELQPSSGKWGRLEMGRRETLCWQVSYEGSGACTGEVLAWGTACTYGFWKLLQYNHVPHKLGLPSVVGAPCAEMSLRTAAYSWASVLYKNWPIPAQAMSTWLCLLPWGRRSCVNTMPVHHQTWGSSPPWPLWSLPRQWAAPGKQPRPYRAVRFPFSSLWQHLSHLGISAAMSTTQDLEEFSWYHIKINPQLMVVYCMFTLPFSLKRTVGSGDTHICKLHLQFQWMLKTESSSSSAMSWL